MGDEALTESDAHQSPAFRVVEDGARRIALTVADTGIGIPHEMLPHVFHLFVQGETDGRSTSGLGIGLALARQLVEMHGGTIGVRSDGPGLTELPLGRESR